MIYRLTNYFIFENSHHRIMIYSPAAKGGDQKFSDIVFSDYLSLKSA